MNSYLQLIPAIIIAAFGVLVVALAVRYHVADKRAEKKLMEKYDKVEDTDDETTPIFVGSRDRPSLLTQRGRR